MVAYPNKQGAMVMAFATIAGITGRIFNVSGMGLNIYVTLLMDSGMGKSDLASCIKRTLVAADDPNKMAFLGNSRFTGVKAIWNMFNTGMSKVSVVNEAVCRGCGNCVASCPSGAMRAIHFTTPQLYREMMEAIR